MRLTLGGTLVLLGQMQVEFAGGNMQHTGKWLQIWLLNTNIFRSYVRAEILTLHLYCSPHCLCLSEFEEFLQALKWVQQCLTDAQSQQDVELIMQLLTKEDFRNAYTIYCAVSQQMSRGSPTPPLTAQAQDLCQEVCIMVIFDIKAENKKSNVEAPTVSFVCPQLQ